MGHVCVEDWRETTERTSLGGIKASKCFQISPLNARKMTDESLQVPFYLNCFRRNLESAKH